MFSGSGAIGIAVLKAIPGARLTFAERDPRCIAQIRLNLRRNNIAPARFRIVRSDVFSRIRGHFDAILANPPYVGAGDRLDSAMRRFEPRGAWYGGRDGLAVIRRFLRGAGIFLKPGGTIWMEFGSGQVRKIRALLMRAGYEHFALRRDQYGRPRFAKIVAGT